ncbi:protein of unknown function [Streptomyces sp. KY75]|nr:protein of unknown function [Streptomyces sp. KY70]CAD5990091.1 protein of unknown function [Streptomyces sp. KY75]
MPCVSAPSSWKHGTSRGRYPDSRISARPHAFPTASAPSVACPARTDSPVTVAGPRRNRTGFPDTTGLEGDRLHTNHPAAHEHIVGRPSKSTPPRPGLLPARRESAPRSWHDRPT